MTSRNCEPSFSIRIDLSGDVAEVEAISERINVECWEAGADGIEERGGSGDISLIIYTRNRARRDVLDAAKRELSALHQAGSSVRGRVGAPDPVDERDWSEAWKDGLDAIEVSSRLVVRPSFVPFELGRRQQEIVIDPGQAFGTGGHASTLLALEWVDALSDAFHARMRVLDVGTGTGVLALAALRLGAGTAVAFDLDPVAVREAVTWAERNGLAAPFNAFVGGIDALAGPPFELVVANLLRTELEPLIPEITQRTAHGGEIVLSGLLARERERVTSAFVKQGVSLQDEREHEDESGTVWISPLLVRDH